MIRLVLLLAAVILVVLSLAEPESPPRRDVVSAAAEGPTAGAQRSDRPSGVTFDPVDRRRRAPEQLAEVAGHDSPTGGGAGVGTGSHVVTGSVVNMRAGPSTANAVVGQMAAGEVVELLRRTGDGWAEIRAVRSGETGFMAARFLAPLS